MQVWVAVVQNKNTYDLIGYDWWIEYITVTILWILTLCKVLYSFLISSLKDTDYDSTTGNKAINRDKGLQAFCPCYLFCICYFSLWNYVLDVTLGIIIFNFTRVLPFLPWLYNWHRQRNTCHCIGNAWVVKNILQPNVEQLGIEEDIFCWNGLRSHLNITRICSLYNICHVYL